MNLMFQIVKFTFESLSIFAELDEVIFLPLHVFSLQTTFCTNTYLNPKRSLRFRSPHQLYYRIV